MKPVRRSAKRFQVDEKNLKQLVEKEILPALQELRERYNELFVSTIGQLHYFATSQPPTSDEWIPCDGTYYPRADYPTAYEVLLARDPALVDTTNETFRAPIISAGLTARQYLHVGPKGF